MSITAQQMQEFLKATLIGESQRISKRVCSLNPGETESVSFCKLEDASAIKILEKTNATTLIVSNSIPDEVLMKIKEKTFLKTKTPRLSFIHLLNRFFAIPEQNGIHPTVIIESSAVMGKNVSIGAYSTIAANCIIGDGTRLFERVTLYPNCVIGKNVRIHSGTVIGVDGYGIERNESGILEKFPHQGGVRIDNDVEIGANVAIARGTLDNTIIGEGTKIDNLVHIAHNVRIGKHCFIIALAEISGSVTIHDRAWISPGACIRNKLIIGENALVGMGAVVVKDVPAGVTVIGNPARPLEKN